MKKEMVIFLIIIIILGIFGMKYFKIREDNFKTTKTIEQLKKNEKESKNEYKVILVTDKKYLKNDKKTLKNDVKHQKIVKKSINTANYLEIREKGFSVKITNKILKYKKFVGKVININDLKMIKGIGNKTLEKLKKAFTIKAENIKNFKKKSIDLKKITENDLENFGISSKKLEKLKDYIKSNKVIVLKKIKKILGSKNIKNIEKVVKINKN